MTWLVRSSKLMLVVAEMSAAPRPAAGLSGPPSAALCGGGFGGAARAAGTPKPLAGRQGDAQKKETRALASPG